MSAQRLSKKFQAEDADAIFESSDGVIFKVHRERLNMFSEGFAAPDVAKTNEKIPLPETAETLELLFQYCYPRRGPSLNALRFNTINDLAEAVEKYQIYMALEPCKDSMQNFSVFEGLGVLKYAIKHDYFDVMEHSKKDAILLRPLETFRYAVKSGNRVLAKDAGVDALFLAPVEVFKLAAKHGYSGLVEEVAIIAIDNRQPNSTVCRFDPTVFEEGAAALRTTYIFRILEYAAENGQEGLMNKAAALSKNNPDFAFVAGELRHKTLVTWKLQYYNQFVGREGENLGLSANRRRMSGPTKNFYSLWVQQRNFTSPPQ